MFASITSDLKHLYRHPMASGSIEPDYTCTQKKGLKHEYLPSVVEIGTLCMHLLPTIVTMEGSY